MNEENRTTENKTPSAPEWSTVKPQSFEEILREFEKSKPAKMYIPFAAIDEEVSVKIYAPGEERQESGRKEKREHKKQLKQEHKAQKQLLLAEREEKLKQLRLEKDEKHKALKAEKEKRQTLEAEEKREYEQQAEEKRLLAEEKKLLQKEKRKAQKEEKKHFAELQKKQKEQLRLEKKEINRLATQAAKEKKARQAAAKQPYNRKGAVTVCLFALMLVTAAAVNIAMPKTDFSPAENRSLASFPRLSPISLKNGSFTQGFEAYLSDHFAFRDEIVKIRTEISSLLGSTETGNVYTGKNGRLFQKPSAFENEKTAKTVEAIYNFCTKSGIKNQMLMLVPNASYILSDELPPLLRLENQGEQIKEIYSLMPEKMKTVDVAGVFMKAKNRDALYYKTDHHWTTPAAKTAFNLLAKPWKLNTDKVKYKYYTLSNEFCGTLSGSNSAVSDTIQACIPQNSTGTYVVTNKAQKTKSTTLFDISKLKNKNQYEVFMGGNFPVVTVSTVNRNDKSLLIFKDSYANCMLPMLTPYFEKITVIDPRYYTSDINRLLKEERFTHVLFLYNVNTFLSDTSIGEVLGG
ncbi:MAG: DHHW family protein [Clostridia bacterium]|nr:DHHW family protein [Clostridia bacterium]